MRIQGNTTPRVRRTADGLHGRSRERSTREDAGVPSMSVLTNMASTKNARGLWFDLFGDYDTALSCKAFHIDVADPYLENGSDYEGFHCLPLKIEGNVRGRLRPPKSTELCDRYVADAVPLTIGVCGQADNPQGHSGERDRHPIHRVLRPQRIKDGPPLTPIMKPYCSTGTTIWAHR